MSRTLTLRAPLFVLALAAGAFAMHHNPAAAAGEESWTKCAAEGGRCDFSGTRKIRYGANGKYVVREMQNGAACNNQTFGDPIAGVAKQCELARAAAGAPAATAEWTRCAKEGEACSFDGLRPVRYGANGKFSTPRNFSKSVQCTNEVFGDPARGNAKQCEYGPPVPLTWTACAQEGETCNFNGMRMVRYGANDKFATSEFMGGVACNNAVFGDPIRGKKKRCEYGPEVEISWTSCANEGEQCTFQGSRQVRYGANGKYVMREAKDGTACNNQVFGDPAPGAKKRCELGPAVR